MKYLKKYLEFFKSNKESIKNVKLIMLLIVNAWLFLIFWKILLLNDVNIINNNQILVKASSFIQPVLNILGLDVLTPNMLKMCVITGIIMISNLAVLYINQMIGLISLAILGRYSYKSYTNYLINSENLSYMGFEDKNKIPLQLTQVKSQETARVIIENTSAAASHTHWGTWIVLGAGLLICFGLLIYSHNTLANDLINTNIISRNTTASINNQLNNVDKKTIVINKQVDLILENHGKRMDKLMDSDTLLNNKIDNLEQTIQGMGEKLVKVGELGNDSVLKLSQQSLILSHKANEAMQEIAEATSTVEATTLGLAKIWEIVKEYTIRVENLEDKAGLIQTPRRISMHFPVQPEINARSKGDDL